MMYKIKYLKTGNIFELPDKTAEELKEKYPSDYKILFKNGKKFADKILPKEQENKESIYSKVIDNDNNEKKENKTKVKKKTK